MKLLITSFGITGPEPLEGEATPFHRMPPVDMRSMNEALFPDYATLLLADKLIMDEDSFESLNEQQTPRRWTYALVADTYNALYREGHLELVRFKDVLSQNSRLLSLMLENDLNSFEAWLEPLQESLRIWRDFMSDSRDLFRPDRLEMSDELRRMYAVGMHEVSTVANYTYAVLAMFEHEQNFGLSDSHEPFYDETKAIVSSYLSYVNANLVLAMATGAGFHDWSDFSPFYKWKFQENPRLSVSEPEGGGEIRKLFEVSFPELRIDNTSAFLSVIQDPRIEDLRSLVSQAVRGEVIFDEEFARRTLFEVFAKRRRSERVRKLTSYATLPIGLIPWVGTFLQKATEEVGEALLERKIMEQHPWFYLLTEVSKKT